MLGLAIAVSAVIAVLNADDEGYSLRGQPADFGSPLVNGLVMFFIVGVPLCGFALAIPGRPRGSSRARRRRRS
jgi:hypothetical protein